MPAQKLGSYRPTPDWWKGMVEEEFERRGRGSKKQCAKEIGHSTAAITQMLTLLADGGQETSRIADKVAEWTGVPLPDELAFSSVGELTVEAIRLRKMNPRLVEHAIAMFRDMRHAEEKARPQPPASATDTVHHPSAEGDHGAPPARRRRRARKGSTPS